ncbi:hypothetical protein FOZ62_015280 [Perkinsus olseni]|uniref:C3H1-type domain-containing protein n=1 Tax=Perkinsus olseni TaxID=32597 RepID=A0A7J6RK96_PEROL|nr:hypothetical protein FOZ62_015280 [Perkinsus olseni]
MASPLEISTKKIVNSLLEGEEVDGQIKDLLVTKLVEEKISSLLLLSNVGNDTITKIVDSLPEESKGSVRLYLVSLVDEAKAAQSLKRRKQEQEVEAADLSSFRDNIKKRFGDNVQVPASMVPPYRVLAKLARNPYDYVPVNEFLTSPSGEQTGVQQMQDLNTGKAVSVQISKSRKVTCLSDWVEGFCRWCTALLMIEPDNQNSDPLSMLYYLSRIVSLANRKDVAAAVGFDHCYRSQLLGRHEQGYSISKVLSSDLDPSLFISAEIGTLSVPGKVFQPLGKGNRKDTPCVFYAKGKCSRGDKCPFKHVKTGKSFYDLSEDSGSQKNGERNRKRQRRSRSPSNQDTAAKRRREAVQARRGDDATHITSFLHSALADNTHKTYNSAVSLYKAFLEPEPPFPLKVEDLQCFVYALSQTRMYKYSSIKTYCGSLKAVNLEKGYALGTTSTFAIKRALQASKKLLGDTTEQKRALSRQEVQLIGSLNDFPGCKLELQCLKGATLLATFALLRAREALALRRGDVSFKADRMVVHIARSKNDQSASGHFIFVGCVAGENEASLESCSAATDPRSFRA